jgi:glycosyltransferase involved in cell wall biosynthesis
VKILLHDNSLTERGTTVAVTAYARALRDQFGASVQIAYREDTASRPAVVNTLKKEFDLIPYWNHSSLQRHVSAAKSDFFYAIKAGAWDNVVVQGPRNLVHAVFQEYQPHGDRYAYVSSWLASKMRRNRRKRLKFHAQKTFRQTGFRVAENAKQFDFVPHIVQPVDRQSDYRHSLGIPSDAVVVGSLSGSSQFDISFVRQWLHELVLKDPNTYVVCPNLRPFADHPRLRFIPTIVDVQEKFDYLHSLDVLIHARSMGETFGLAIAEALAVGTPVLAHTGGRDRNHIEMLAGSGWLYATRDDLETRHRNLVLHRDAAINQAKQLTEPYSPQNVMRRFSEIFLQ